MNTEHKGIEPVAWEVCYRGMESFITRLKNVAMSHELEGADIFGLTYANSTAQSAIDTLQAEKAALEKQRDELLVVIYGALPLLKNAAEQSELHGFTGSAHIKRYKAARAAIANAKGAAA